MRRSLLAPLLASCALAGEVRTVDVPAGGRVPDVVAAGAVVHMVWGAEGDAFYGRSEDGGRAFGAPLRVNRKDGECGAFGERGPKLAVSSDGTVHVVWQPSRLVGIRYARLAPGASAFEAPRELLAAGAVAEGVTIAAGGSSVLVVYLDGKSGAPANSPLGLPLFAVGSSDGGATFGAPGPLANDYDGGACACCNLQAALDGEGRFVVAFRGAKDAVRDLFLLRGDAEGKAFHTVRVSREDWVQNGCPMDGPRLCARGDDLFVAYTVKTRAAFSRVRGDESAPPVRPQRLGEGAKQAIVLANGDDELLLAWMDREGSLRWELLGKDGAVLSAGDAGAVRQGSRPAGFVDAEGGFVLVR